MATHSSSRWKRPHPEKLRAMQMFFSLMSVLSFSVNHDNTVSAFVIVTQTKATSSKVVPPRERQHTRLKALDYLHAEQGPFRQSQLTKFWGRYPMLIRNAFDPEELQSTGAWPTWGQVCQWATESEGGISGDDFSDEFPVMSRLVRQQSSSLDSFTLELGPFPGSYLQEISSSDSTIDSGNWTLLLNDVDRIHRPLSTWMEKTFGGNFLPRWRRDDGQISIAKTGGGIGPHVDNYDVFLIQTSGTRQWQMGDFITTEEELNSLIDGLEVRILDLENQEDQEPMGVVEMNPGDMLYLPPRLVHWGTALSDDCMTLSVGCRAPSASELVSKLAEQISYSFAPNAVRRYTDADLLSIPRDITGANGCSITDTVKQKLRLMVVDAISEIVDDPLLWDEMAGSALTAPKRPTEVYSYYDSDDLDEDDTPVNKVLFVVSKDGKGALYPTEGVSFATSHCSDGWHHYYRIYADGEKFEMKIWNRVHATEEHLLKSIENGVPLTKSLLQRIGLSPEVVGIVSSLLERGFLYYSEIVVEPPEPELSLPPGVDSSLAPIDNDKEVTPVSRVMSVMNKDGRGALYPLEGVEFKTLRFEDEFNQYFRVLAEGQTFEMKITNRKYATEEILLEAIEEGVPINRTLLRSVGLSPQVIEMLASLLEEGLYYFAERRGSSSSRTTTAQAPDDNAGSPGTTSPPDPSGPAPSPAPSSNNVES